MPANNVLGRPGAWSPPNAARQLLPAARVVGGCEVPDGPGVVELVAHPAECAAAGRGVGDVLLVGHRMRNRLDLGKLCALDLAYSLTIAPVAGPVGKTGRTLPGLQCCWVGAISLATVLLLCSAVALSGGRPFIARQPFLP